VSTGTGVGINALLSRRLGERRFEDASLVAVNGIFLAVLSALAFALFGFFGVEPFFRAFTNSSALLKMGAQYTSIVSIFSFGVFMSIAGERIIQATGNTFYSMVAQMSGAVTNIILDPILIFGLLGMPRLEVAGAAIATVIGQFVSMGVILWMNHKKNHEVRLTAKGFRPNGRIIREIYRIGLPSIIMQALGSVMTFGMNKILILFSQTAVAVFGIYFKLQSFVFMPVFGLTNAMIPIVGYNYGARDSKRIMQTIRLSGAMAVTIMTVGTLMFQLLPGWALRNLFDASPEMLEVGVSALRIISISFIPAAIAIVCSSGFQALGNGMYSLGISFCRQIGVILPAAYLLGRYVGLSATWWAFPLSEAVSLTMSVVMFGRMYHRQIKTLEMRGDGSALPSD
ncbi:MAG: MATE family efflux transporter, partial [Oscillospiraceae bacterium]